MRKQVFPNHNGIALILRLIVYCLFLKDAPVQPKKAKLQEAQKLKKMISKTLNTAMENDIRERALEGKKTLTKKNPSNLKKQ